MKENLNNKQLIKVLKKQIQLCLRHHRFNSIVFVSHPMKKSVVFEYLEWLCSANRFASRNVMQIRNNASETLVYFKNDSLIRVAVGNVYLKGIRANNVVIDSDIKNQDVIDGIIRPFLCPPSIIPPKWKMKLFGIQPHYRENFKMAEYIVKI